MEGKSEIMILLDRAEMIEKPSDYYTCYADEPYRCMCLGHKILRKTTISEISDDDLESIAKIKDLGKRQFKFNELVILGLKKWQKNKIIEFEFRPEPEDEPEDEEEDEPEAEEWDQIYNDWKKANANKYMPKGSKNYNGYKYIQTYGGGGEGGYFYKNKKSPVYEVSRNWFESFTVNKIDSFYKLEIKKDPYNNDYYLCRLTH